MIRMTVVRIDEPHPTTGWFRPGVELDGFEDWVAENGIQLQPRASMTEGVRYWHFDLTEDQRLHFKLRWSY